MGLGVNPSKTVHIPHQQRAQWRFKLASYDELNEQQKEAVDILPAWFTWRMMTDHWTFGLLTDTGVTIVVDHISRVVQASDGTLWLDVEMASRTPLQGGELTLFTSPTNRTSASISVSHVVAAFELADT